MHLLPAYRGVKLGQCPSLRPRHRTVQTGSEDCGRQDGGAGQWCNEYHPGNRNTSGTILCRMLHRGCFCSAKWLVYGCLFPLCPGSLWFLLRLGSDVTITYLWRKISYYRGAESEPVSWMTLASQTGRDGANQPTVEERRRWHHLRFHCLRTINRSETVLAFSHAR